MAGRYELCTVSNATDIFPIVTRLRSWQEDDDEDESDYDGEGAANWDGEGDFGAAGGRGGKRKKKKTKKEVDDVEEYTNDFVSQSYLITARDCLINLVMAVDADEDGGCAGAIKYRSAQAVVIAALSACVEDTEAVTAGCMLLR